MPTPQPRPTPAAQQPQRLRGRSAASRVARMRAKRRGRDRPHRCGCAGCPGCGTSITCCPRAADGAVVRAADFGDSGAIQRRLAAPLARGALLARRGGAARRPRLGGPAARRHGALAVVRQPGRGLHLGRAALRERDALHAAPVSPPPRLTAALPVAGLRDGGGGEERRRGRCRRARETRPSRAGPARPCRHRSIVARPFG